MTQSKVDGLVQMDDNEAFHQKMKALYKKQGRLDDNKEGNDYHVGSKLPASLYTDFFNFLKDQKMSVSTGIKYAIYSLINEKQS